MPFDGPLPQFDIRADFWSLRFVEERCETYAVRKNVAMPFVASTDSGAMATVYVDGGYGYAATGDISPSGLRDALERAAHWARSTSKLALFDTSALPRPAPRGEYASPSFADRFPARREWYDLLAAESAQAGCDPRIVDWESSVDVRTAIHRLVTSTGGDVIQRYRFLLPGMAVTAHADGVTQDRTLNGYRGLCQQGGTEILARFGFRRRRPEDCRRGAGAPRGAELSERDDGRAADAPDQMVLQIHESIGHPLELDRILGDERNFAGTSFVTPDMFGTYRYGSDLLNVTFDPIAARGTCELRVRRRRHAAPSASHLIRAGILERPLGGAISQARADLPGVANSRADSWNRPPIDRMANLNLEPGDATFDDLVASIEHGVLMETNRSWSIDDSRNKFQFGCERGPDHRERQARHVVKNPNYRGISANFWRSLKRVGNADTLQVLGTPYCGKGEPSQAIRVGHATPACVFGNVDVFGGEA